MTVEPQISLSNARDAAALFEPRFASCVRERLLVAHLDRERRLLHLAEDEIGTGAFVAIPVRAIVADAIRLGSAGLILGHCHPSGDPNPSAQDIAATRKLSDIAAGLGISLHDHLIFGGSKCVSFRAAGLL